MSDPSLRLSCSNPWTSAFIWGNGDVTHCCYSNAGAIGSINRSSLDTIWRGKKIVRIRNLLRRGHFIRAGCEHYCRVFRWHRYYRELADPPAIPEGLGRIQDIDEETTSPPIISLAIDGACNLRCTHCLAVKKTPGLSPSQVVDLTDNLSRARVARVVNGEFSINPKAHEIIAYIASLPKQPTLFLNTHGQTPLRRYLAAIEPLRSFHLKFSLEGLGEDYERIRRGGRWDLFLRNLQAAKAYFASRTDRGDDWRLYLNYCVMKSNFAGIPEVIGFARRESLPLVLNTINGMRHLDENIFMYADLVPPIVEQHQVRKAAEQLLAGDEYPYATQVDTHLDYIFRVLEDRKLWLPGPLERLITTAWKGNGLAQDRALYMLYKLRFNPASLPPYLLRKLRKTVQLRLRGAQY
ncbi:MAG: radical SAM protein [bacterium]|nr:radical SAM protein [bacterium]